MERFPILRIYIKQMNFTVPVSVLTTDQQDLSWRYGECATGPKGVLHSYGEDLPQVLFHFIKLNTIIDLLFCATEESTKRIDAFITDRTSAQVMSLVFHWSDLSPLIFPDVVFLYRAQSLFPRKSTKHKHRSLTDSDSMSISALIHLSLIQNLVLLGQVNPSILLWWWSSTSNQDLSWAKSDRCRALIEFMACIIRKLLDCPFVFVHIVAQADLWIDIISEKVNVSLILRSSVQTWELE